MHEHERTVCADTLAVIRQAVVGELELVVATDLIRIDRLSFISPKK